MSNIIQWADYAQALDVIAEEQAAVSGMSVAEAAAALDYIKTGDAMYLKTIMTTAAESTAGAAATEVAAGATGAATTTAVNLTLLEGAGGTAEVAGIGSIALPVAACVAAAAGGYLIGKELDKNEAYHSFWDNLVFKTCDFVTGNNFADELLTDAPITPMIYDVYGNAYLLSGLTANVKSYLDLFAPTGQTIADFLATNYNIYNCPATDDKYIVVQRVTSGTNTIRVFVSNVPFKAVHYDIYTLLVPNDDTSCAQYIYNAYGILISETPAATGTYWFSSNTAYFPYINQDAVYWGDEQPEAGALFSVEGKLGVTCVGRASAGSLPLDVIKYTPTASTIAPKIDPAGNSWVPIWLPSTSPTEMPSGEVAPITVDPSRLAPYIAPFQPQPAGVPIVIPTTPTNAITLPNPEPDTSTDPYPASDPNLDPSQLTEPLAQPEPENLPEPANTGSSKAPILPLMPAFSSAKGLIHVYNPTPTQVDQFGEWLWTTFSGDLIDTIGKLFNNPMDAVIGLHEIYCTPTESATDVNIRAGFLESNVASRLVTERYAEIKCGALSVPEYWGNYLDYAPYTKSYCYLPFIGIVELNTDDVVGSGVEITYRIDVYNGSCIALITTAKANSDESVSYQFEGNCAVTVPITSGMMSAVQNALIGVATTALSAGATAAVTVATGGTALPAAAMLGTVGAGASKQGLTSKNQVQYSGSFGSSFGAMGIKIPFLIIKRPRQKVVYGYNTNYGYPAHKMVLLSACHGYLKAIEVNVVSPTATEAEKKMIEECLKTGVFID